MAFNRHIGNYIREHKPLFMAVLVGLFLLELEIFVIAATKSGTRHVLVIKNHQGQVVYEATVHDLNAFDSRGFEKTFGPLKDYDVRQTTREVAFPFRAWFVAAFGLPLGGMLLFAFIVRAFVAVFHGDRRPGPENSPPADEAPGEQESRSERILDKIGRLNIFAMGFFIFLVVISYWILPNVLVYLGKISIATIIRYRWFFLTGTLIVLGIFIWIVYLRYLLAKKHIESQTELDRYRLQLQYGTDRETRSQLLPTGTKALPPPQADRHMEP